MYARDRRHDIAQTALSVKPPLLSDSAVALDPQARQALADCIPLAVTAVLPLRSDS